MTLSLSQLKAPTEEAIINPFAEKVEAEVNRLCYELGIWQPHIDEYNTMSAYLFPYAKEKQLLAIGLYNNLLYYVDDTYDRHKEEQTLDPGALKATFNEAAHVFATGIEAQNPNPITNTVKAIHDLLSEIAPSEAWFKRFVRDTLEHLASSLQDVRQNLPDASSTWFDYYNQIRDLDSGMSPTIDLVELAIGFTIPDTVYSNELIKEAHMYVTRYCSLTNDLFSYDKEVVRYGSEFSSVVMLQRDGYSIEGAVYFLIEELNGMVERFRTLFTEIRSEELSRIMTDDALRYMDCLWYQIVAAYHWQFDTNRYRSPDATFVELRTFIPKSDAVA